MIDHLNFIETVNSYDQNGKLLVKNQSSTFIVGAGNFGGKSKASDEVKPAVPTPNRPYDASVRYTTHLDQAAIYRSVLSSFIDLIEFLIIVYESIDYLET